MDQNISKKRQDLCQMINKKNTMGITNILPKAHHLIYDLQKDSFLDGIWKTARLDSSN